MVSASADRLVAAYLRTRGYRRTEDNLRKEADLSTGSNNSNNSIEDLLKSGTNVSIPDSILFFSEAEARNVNAYQDSFARLREWVDGSISQYRRELTAVLFPIFVHAYLDLTAKGFKEKAKTFFDTFQRDLAETHRNELRTLQNVVEPQHVDENEVASQFRRNRYAVPLSRYSFELLLAFFEGNKFMLLLRILNEHVHIAVTRTGPSDSDVPQPAGFNASDSSQVQPLEGRLDVPAYPLPADLPFLEELEYRVREEIEDLAEGSKERKEYEALQEQVETLKEEAQKKVQADDDTNNKVENDQDNDGDPNKGKDDDLGQSDENGNSVAAFKLPAKRFMDIPATIRTLNDIRHRVSLGPQALPSICMYTFHNTANSLNTLNFSDDGNLVAAGYADSTIQLYNVSGAPLGTGSRKVFADETDIVSTRLVGHSGPVYGTSFSADHRYMVSCSEDRSARLWSLDTLSNVVAYKAHNYPVWDVDFAPQGWYFATGSYDGTARLFSCDHANTQRMYVGHLSDVTTVKFHPGGNLLGTGSTDRTVRLWDVQRGDCLRILARHRAPVGTIAMSEDGRKIASASADGTVVVWDISAGKPLCEFPGEANGSPCVVNTLSFSRDSSVLASGGSDGIVRIYDVATGLETEQSPLEGGGSTPANGQQVSSQIDHQSGTVANSNTLPVDGSTPVRGRKASLLAAYPTRNTPIMGLHFSRTNVLLAAGPFSV